MRTRLLAVTLAALLSVSLVVGCAAPAAPIAPVAPGSPTTAPSAVKEAGAAGFDPELSTYPYPFPVRLLELESQRQELRKAYMDVQPELVEIPGVEYLPQVEAFDRYIDALTGFIDAPATGPIVQ
jgi:hypothetical protein